MIGMIEYPCDADCWLPAITFPALFEIEDNKGEVIGTVGISSSGARLYFGRERFGRENLRAIGHCLMNIANFDMGLKE